MSKALQYLVAFMAIGVIALVFWPPFLYHHGSPNKVRALSNLKQVQTGHIIYQSDYDNRYPWAFTDTDWQAALTPYTKFPDIFKPVAVGFGTPTMNFNLAGVPVDYQLGATPLGASAKTPAEDILSAYVVISDPEVTSCAVIARANGSVKSVPKAKVNVLFEGLAVQFNRPAPGK